MASPDAETSGDGVGPRYEQHRPGRGEQRDHERGGAWAPVRRRPAAPVADGHCGEEDGDDGRGLAQRRAEGLADDPERGHLEGHEQPAGGEDGDTEGKTFGDRHLPQADRRGSYHFVMGIRIVRLGSERVENEGLRVGTVRRPPRGVKKERIASENWYDVWLPQLAPSAELVKQALSATSAREWETFVRRYRAEMATPDNARLLALLAALSARTNLSVGCYCEDESHCHRSVLRELLREQGADVE
jgi:uncharacterized protein YeaO (DUF488 family)